MHIDIAIDQLEGLISFFERYRDNGFMSAIISTKEFASENCVICRKNKFDETISEERKNKNA